MSLALQSDVTRLERIPKDGTHAPLLAAMKAAPAGEVALAAVKVDGKAVALLFADEIGDTLIATRRMQELARGRRRVSRPAAPGPAPRRRARCAPTVTAGSSRP